MFANIGPAEAIIILIALISAIFGRKKTTEIARDVGQASLEFKKAQKEYKDAVEDLKKPVNEVLNTNPVEEAAKPEKLSDKFYLKELQQLQVELVKLQEWIR